MFDFRKKQIEKDKKEREEKEKVHREALINAYTTLARTYAMTYPLADPKQDAEVVYLSIIISGANIALAPLTAALKRE